MIKSDKDYTLFVLALSRMTFLSLKEKFILLNNIDSLYDLVILSIEDISKKIGRKSRAYWNPSELIRMVKKDLYLIEKMNISFVLYNESNYPSLLKEISDPPFLLFYRGDIKVLENNCVSVVGTRKIVGPAAEECFDFSKDAALDGITVISGLAYGVDKKAHEGAIEAFFEANDKNLVGKTVAVLPSGIDEIVPSGHKRLVSKILSSGGCIISEYPPGEGAKPYRFVQRNRIIAGLSLNTVIIQAPPGSGAMLTAEFAVDYNREVMVHSVAFCEESLRISTFVRNQLLLEAKFKESIGKKLNNDPEYYVQDGAKIIKSYADYKLICNKIKFAQKTLFD